MPKSKTRAELEAEVGDLRDENEALQDQLDAVADIVAPDEDDGEDDSEGEEGDQGEE